MPKPIPRDSWKSNLQFQVDCYLCLATLTETDSTKRTHVVVVLNEKWKFHSYHLFSSCIGSENQNKGDSNEVNFLIVSDRFFWIHNVMVLIFSWTFMILMSVCPWGEGGLCMMSLSVWLPGPNNLLGGLCSWSHVPSRGSPSRGSLYSMGFLSRGSL